jgi:hypothetical protein
MPCDKVEARWTRSHLYCRMVARHAKSTNLNPASRARLQQCTRILPAIGAHRDTRLPVPFGNSHSFSSHPLPTHIILPMMGLRFRRMDRTWKYSTCSKLAGTCKGPPFPPICSRTPSTLRAPPSNRSELASSIAPLLILHLRRDEMVKNEGMGS